MSRLRLGCVGVYFLTCLLAVSFLTFITHAQQVGRNVNMVSGTTLPGGDPYLQRQNEPSGGVSTRNPMHLMAGANDYRTVDLPGIPEAVETGDAWQGVFKSIDGGQSWFSTLLPGYPQDTSPEGMASPIRGYETASDPVVRAGTNRETLVSRDVRRSGAQTCLISVEQLDRDGESVVSSSNASSESVGSGLVEGSRFLHYRIIKY